jgi:hypothetical protein
MESKLYGATTQLLDVLSRVWVPKRLCQKVDCLQQVYGGRQVLTRVVSIRTPVHC